MKKSKKKLGYTFSIEGKKIDLEKMTLQEKEKMAIRYNDIAMESIGYIRKQSKEP